MKNSVKSLIKKLLLLELLRELTYTYMYVAVVDDRTCDPCLKHDTRTYTGDQLLGLFPYLQGTVGDSVLLPIVHNHCRCMIILLEVGI
jgi:hypothetical protein